MLPECAYAVIEPCVGYEGVALFLPGEWFQCFLCEGVAAFIEEGFGLLVFGGVLLVLALCGKAEQAPEQQGYGVKAHGLRFHV